LVLRIQQPFDSVKMKKSVEIFLNVCRVLLWGCIALLLVMDLREQRKEN